MSEFSPGEFKSLGTKRPEKEKPAEGLPEQTHEAAEEATSIFACPKDGCVKVFQRLSSLEKHLSLERCTRSLEKQTLLDLAWRRVWPAYPSLLPLQSQRRLQLTGASIKAGLSSVPKRPIVSTNNRKPTLTRNLPLVKPLARS